MTALKGRIYIHTPQVLTVTLLPVEAPNRHPPFHRKHRGTVVGIWVGLCQTGRTSQMGGSLQWIENRTEGLFCLQVEPIQPFSQHDSVLNCLFTVNLFTFVPNAEAADPSNLPR